MLAVTTAGHPPCPSLSTPRTAASPTTSMPPAAPPSKAGASVMENPLPSSGNYGRAWFAGWLDGLADRLDGGDRATPGLPAAAGRYDGANFYSELPRGPWRAGVQPGGLDPLSMDELQRRVPKHLHCPLERKCDLGPQARPARTRTRRCRGDRDAPAARSGSTPKPRRTGGLHRRSPASRQRSSSCAPGSCALDRPGDHHLSALRPTARRTSTHWSPARAAPCRGRAPPSGVSTTAGPSSRIGSVAVAVGFELLRAQLAQRHGGPVSRRDQLVRRPAPRSGRGRPCANSSSVPELPQRLRRQRRSPPQHVADPVVQLVHQRAAAAAPPRPPW